MDWRIRIPSASYRLAVARLGSDAALAERVRAYIERLTVPPPGSALGAAARVAKQTPEERQSIARKAAQARWAKRDTA